MNNVSDLGREDGFWKSKESHTSKWSEGSRRNCESNLTTATGGERSVSPADTRFNHSRDHPGVSDSVNTDCELKQVRGK